MARWMPLKSERATPRQPTALLRTAFPRTIAIQAPTRPKRLRRILTRLTRPQAPRQPATKTRIPAKPRSGSSRYDMSWKARVPRASAICFRCWRKRPIARASNCRSPPRRPISTASPPTSSLFIPATVKSSAASRASSAGTRWRWWSERTRNTPGIGGHISTFASAATLYEVAFNHFFHGKGDNYSGDQIYFQGHALARHLFPSLHGRPARPKRS